MTEKQEMSTERRNEIGYRIYMRQLGRKGLGTKNPNDFRREVCNAAKELNLKEDEMLEFARITATELHNNLIHALQ